MSAQQDERCSCLRNGKIENINPSEIVVGDILILQTGDLITADCIIITKDIVVESDEASLTGESNVVKKSYENDPFLLSSCLITRAEQIKAVVIGIGKSSQWYHNHHYNYYYQHNYHHNYQGVKLKKTW